MTTELLAPAVETGPAETMTTAPMARPSRRIGWLGRIVWVGALALLLTGLFASPADAARPQAVMRANLGVTGCFNTGGDPHIYEHTGTYNAFYFSCFYDDGTYYEYTIEYGD